MNFDKKTRKLSSGSGYIHRLDDSLYTDHPIYLGKSDRPENYEEGDEADYQEWLNKKEGE